MIRFDDTHGYKRGAPGYRISAGRRTTKQRYDTTFRAQSNQVTQKSALRKSTEECLLNGLCYVQGGSFFGLLMFLAEPSSQRTISDLVVVAQRKSTSLGNLKDLR